MSRLIWPAFLACAVLLLGALGVISVRVVEAEASRKEAEVQADVGQRVRLAMWRMDSEAAAMLVLENNRPTAQFRAFSDRGAGGEPVPSPLLTHPPDHAHLYFEVGDDGVLRSPQVPAPGNGLDPGRFVAQDELARRTGLRARLRDLLELREADTLAQADERRPAAAGGNFDIAFAAAQNAVTPDVLQTAPTPREDTPAVAQELGQGQQQAMPQAKGTGQARLREEDANRNEFNRRAGLVQRAMAKNNYSQQARSQATAQEPAVANDANAPAGGFAEARDRDNAPARAAAPATIQPQAAPGGAAPGPAVPGGSPGPQPEGGSGGVSPPPLPPVAAAPAAEEAQVTTFQPVWIAGELLMVRSVNGNGHRRIQGLWLKREALAESLLGAVRDLLPAATLRPYQPLVFTRDNVLNPDGASALSPALWKATPKAMDNAPLALVSLPWELVPGALPVVASSADPALRLLLGSAWIGALLAIAAAAALLRGVMALSERRASFVSSVTHELRTPLTTFRLYSEMLAEDMVPDGEKRRGYLRTLQAEATRLTHLVENVLAYSRVERGSARARVEETTAAALAARIVPRLEERVAAAGAALAVELPDDVGALALRTDVTAVEQILFNLVDNACKYALGPEGSPPLQVRFAAAGAMLAVEVCDHGPGVGPAERKRLFRPFSKSAEDAANSKPGIGLGLSLSLRLARALGGKLELVDRKDQPGACFRLLLPLRPPPAR